MKKFFLAFTLLFCFVSDLLAEEWDWFLAPAGTRKEFELRLPAEDNKIVGKVIHIISEIKEDPFGDKLVKILSKVTFDASSMSASGYDIYKIDFGGNRVVKIESYNDQLDIRRVWNDPHPYFVMSFPLSIGKGWKYHPTSDTKTFDKKITGKKTIKLPAGEFETIIIEDQGFCRDYYAKGIGLVASDCKNTGNKWHSMTRLIKVTTEN